MDLNGERGNMEIIERKTTEIHPYEGNPRNNEAAIPAVMESIRQFGFKVPIIIDEKDVIIAGHTRLKAAERLGMETVPCIKADDLTPEQVKAFRIADNKTAELSTWDFEALNVELSEIEDIDMSAFGFDMSEIEDIPEPEDDEYEEPEEIEPTVQRGQVWGLGEHRLMCGDATEQNDVKRLMGGQKADMVFTDPPYNIETRGGNGNSNIHKSIININQKIDFIADFSPEKFLHVLNTVFHAKTFNTYIFTNKTLLPDYLNWCIDNGYSYDVLVWKKPSGIPLNSAHYPDIEYLCYFRKSATFNNGLDGVNYSRCLQYGRAHEKLHPTMKPIELIGNEILISSNTGERVVDFFGGSGSTLIAAEQLGRKCYMMEIDPHYCDVIIDRWEQYTGGKAELIDGNEKK